jgi:hypothetical protein
MDEPTQPTAAELGIGEVEYEQILRDVRQRQSPSSPDPLLSGQAR